jgi:hypothetical protein
VFLGLYFSRLLCHVFVLLISCFAFISFWPGDHSFLKYPVWQVLGWHDGQSEQDRHRPTHVAPQKNREDRQRPDVVQLEVLHGVEIMSSRSGVCWEPAQNPSRAPRQEGW